MLLSMTGYGKAEYTFADHKTIVEIRSLNSKQLDLTLKVSPLYRDKEPAIRSILSAPLERGKVDVAVYTQPLDNTATGEQSFTPINKEAFRYYYRELTALQSELRMPGNIDLIGTIMRIPDVCKNDNDNSTLPDEEWELLQQALQTAMDGFIAFRTQEGESLQRMFTDKLNGIETLLAEVAPYETNRVANIKQHLLANLEKLSEETKQQIDRNRLEAELIYYLEKLDITEEKVRLTNHIRYFRETMNLTSDSASGLTAERSNLSVLGVGKKLGFIAQEMGREINTLGSKSNQSEMQIIVVKMKDILEQIKEQVLNVL